MDFVLIIFILAMVVLGVFCGLALFAVVQYNGLVRFEQHYEREWARVEADVLRQRFKTAQSMLTQYSEKYPENSAFESLLAGRDKVLKARNLRGRIIGELQLEEAIDEVLTFFQSSKNVQEDSELTWLLSSLRQFQEQAAAEREKYNDIVEAYNKQRVCFPLSKIVNALGHTNQAPYFDKERLAKQPAPAPVGPSPEALQQMIAQQIQQAMAAAQAQAQAGGGAAVQGDQPQMAAPPQGLQGMQVQQPGTVVQPVQATIPTQSPSGAAPGNVEHKSE